MTIKGKLFFSNKKKEKMKKKKMEKMCNEKTNDITFELIQ